MVASSAAIWFSGTGVYQGAWASHLRSPGEELTGPQCKDIWTGAPLGAVLCLCFKSFGIEGFTG